MAIENRPLPPSRSTLNVTSAISLGAANAPAAGAPGVTVPVHCMRVLLNTPGSSVSTINDCASTGAASAANTILTIPIAAVAGTTYVLDWPCFVGLTITPGTGAVLSIAWNPS